MCGRYEILYDTDYFAFRYQIKFDGQVPESRKEIFPTNSIPIIINEDGKRALKMVKWGIVPSWAKTPTKPLINARSETVSEKPTFKNLLKNQRCLIPASGFFEWATEGTKKTKYLFKCTDQKLFAMAGLWTHSADGIAATIITGSANTLIAPIHDRMPMILDPKDEEQWVLHDYDTELLRLLRSYPSDTMTKEPVINK